MNDLRAEFDDLAGGHSLSTYAPADPVACFKHCNVQAGERQGLGASESGCTSPEDRHVYRVHGIQSRDRAR